MATTRTVLLRSSWANVNIGDVAHSPGLIAALRRYAPDAEIVLWPVRLGEREEAMLRQADPRLVIARGDHADGVPIAGEVREVWDRADLFVHGSAGGAFLDAEISAWCETGKPHGYAGVTVDPLCPPTWGRLAELRVMAQALPPTFHLEPNRTHLDSAEFVFARDSITLQYLRKQGIAPATLDFGPDGTFAYDYLDDVAADAFLAELGLTDGAFGCFVPRVRYTPYPDIYPHTVRDREWERKYAINVATVGPDMQVLAAAIATWVRATGQPAVVVPEMSYAVETAKKDLVPLLADDVREQVIVLGRYWALEEASSVYARSRAVVSMECHSPIMASVHGIPTLYLRQPTDTVKGEMYADLGGGDIVVEVERDGQAGASVAVERLLADEAAARATSELINRTATARLADMAATILSGAPAAPYAGPAVR